MKQKKDIQLAQTTMHVVWAIPTPYVGCCGLSLAFVCLCWPAIALRWPSLASVGVVGLRWRRWPVLVSLAFEPVLDLIM
jgi:hypothetical protein